MNRVVITGVGSLTPLGHDWATVERGLRARESGVRYIEDWDRFHELNTRLGVPAAPFELPSHYNRKSTRSMGRVALLSTRATELALDDAGLLGDPLVSSGDMGIAYGASAGSLQAILPFGRMEDTGRLNGVTSNTYVQMMSHTGPVNIGVFFKVRGRIIPTSSACTSGSQGVGYAYEAIRFGRQTAMIAGGAEELNAATAAVFDTLYATSVRNDAPESSPRPFDRDRDGLVVGEGATTLILEEYEHARRRGARIYAEIVGYGTNADGAHITQPQSETMGRAMQMALDDAGIGPEQVGFVSAHGTATDRGDVAESHATLAVMGPKPVHSLKSYFGHTLGACGSLEAWLAVEMMNAGWFAPTINLDNVDPDCAELDYVVGEGRSVDTEYVMSNNCAFGGINSSLIFRRFPGR